ncbi:MAG: hypothetical protein ACO1Q7_01010 [Gemmatimonas sp.]
MKLFAVVAQQLKPFRTATRWCAVLCAMIVCSAHIGSPDAWFNGNVGPYRALIHVQAPPVVPGIAVISIRPEEKVALITAFVNKYDAKVGAPPPDEAKSVASEPGWFRTQLWVMDPGSNSVTVAVTGDRGEGTVVIPLVAVAGRRLAFDGVLSALLAIAGLVLVAGLVTIIGASVRESVLTPGHEADAARRKRARFAMLRGAIVIAIALGGLGVWWRAEDRVFAQNLFKPLRASTRVTVRADSLAQLALVIDDPAWTERHVPQRARPRGGSEFADLVEDHGKLMHLFLVAENGRSFAHVHPSTRDSVTFTSELPPLPAGRYRVFADILHATGLTQTLLSTIDVPSQSPSSAAAQIAMSDDDSWIADVNGSDGNSATLADGSTLRLLSGAGPRRVGEEAKLQFSVTPSPGDTARIEPYLGMSGHVAVVRDDGKVFIHLHPLGTISMGAQQLLSRDAKLPSTSPATSRAHIVTSHAASHDSVDLQLSFPYAFPSAGNYTVWLQVKRRGRVLTGAFRVQVLDAVGER